jgi:hypothetical protein
MDARDEPRHGCPVRNEGDIMETSAISAASMAPQLSQQAHRSQGRRSRQSATGTAATGSKNRTAASGQQHAGQRTGTLVNTTA